MGISAAAAFSNTEKEVKLIPSTKVFYAKGTHAMHVGLWASYQARLRITQRERKRQKIDPATLEFSLPSPSSSS